MIKCSICAKELPEATGHNHWMSYLVLGSNTNESDSIRYDEVCDDCTEAIRTTIKQQEINKKLRELKSYFSK